MSSRNQLLLIIALFLGVSVWYYMFNKPTHVRIGENDLVVGTNSEFQPFTFMDQNQIVGFDIDVITEVAKRLKKNLILQNMPFEALIPEIQLGNIQVIAAGMTPSDQRAERVFFTKKIFAGDPLVIVTLKKNSDIKDLKDLYHKNVLVNEGYTSDLELSKTPEIQLTRLASPLISDGLLALENESGSAFVASQSSIAPYFKKFGKEEFNIIPIEGTEEADALAVSKHYPELLSLINDTINSMEADGTLKGIQEKWELV